MKAIFRILTLTVVATLFAGAASATTFKIKGASPIGLEWNNPTTMTPEDGKYVYTCTATSPGNQTFAVLKDDVQMLCSAQELEFDTDYTCNTSNNYNQYNIYCTTGFSYKITVTETTNGCTIRLSDNTEKYTVNATATYGTPDAASKQCVVGGSVTFTITPTEGYEFSSYTFDGVELSSSVVVDGNTYTVTPTANNQTLSVTFTAQQLTVTPSYTASECTPSPSTAQTVAYNGSQSFTIELQSGYYLNTGSTLFTGDAQIAFSKDADDNDVITLSGIKQGGTLTIACASSQTPVVYWAQYPEVGINAISLYGYLGERYCKTVTAAGFYWSTSEIDDDDVRQLVEDEEESDNLVSTTTTPVSEFKNGTNFLGSVGQTNAAFAAITDPTVIYLVNYVQTEGGVGISDHVAVYYKPCKGMQSITLTPAEASIAAGYSAEFSVVARSAGKSPVYTWYLDASDTDISEGSATPISGATSDTYEYTMESTATTATTHTIKVKVTDQCGNSQWTHDSPVVDGITATKKVDVTGCATPTFNISADQLTTTPWVERTLTISDAANYYSADWCVVPATAELSSLTKGSAKFRAPVNSGTSTTYTVTYTAKGACGNSTVEVSKTVDITVQKDTEDCTE